MLSDLQLLILEAGRQSGLVTADVIQACHAGQAGNEPLLKRLRERHGFSAADLDRVLERFWAQSGARRGQLHRDVEDRIAAHVLVEKGAASDAQVKAGLKERDDRQATGQRVRLLSVLIDAGVIPYERAQDALDETRARYKFCRYCLSSFADEAGESCAVCGRPLSPAARTYEITELSTVATDTAPQGQPALDGQVAEPPPVGAVLGGVKLLAKVDTLGRGVVYRGQRVGDGEPRAVKVWQPNPDLTAEDIVRFGSSALASARLEHESVLRVFEAGEENGVHFVITEWVEGTSLAEHLERRGALDARLAAEVLLKACGAIEAAHKEGVLHKNLTPRYILLGDDGAVKVSSFGTCGDYGVSLNQVTESTLGSSEYLAPEQCEGTKADERTDIYSLGLTFYHALSGKKPFEGDSAVSATVKRLTQDPEPLAKVAPKAPKPLVRIVDRMIRRKPDKRYQTIAEVREAVDAYKNPPPTFLSKHGKLIGIVTATVLLLGGLGVGTWWYLTHMPTDPEVLRQLGTVSTLMRENEFERAYRQLERVEGMYGVVPESAAMRGDLAEQGLVYAGEARAGRRYDAALGTLSAVVSAAGDTEAGRRARELKEEVRAEAEAYREAAKTAYFQLERDLEDATDAEALPRLEGYAERFPHTEWADRVEVRLGEVRSRLRGGEVLAEVERMLRGLEPRDPRMGAELMVARRKLDEVRAGEVSPATRVRLDRLIQDLELLEQLRDALEDSRVGQHEAALTRLELYANQHPDDGRVRKALAEARYRDLKHEADEHYEAKDKRALGTYRQAVLYGDEAGLDTAEVRERIRQLELETGDAEDTYATAERLAREGDAFAARERWREAHARYEQALALVPRSEVYEAKVEEAARKARVGEEQGDYDRLQQELATKRLPKQKADAIVAYLRKYPEGAYSAALKEQLERLAAQHPGLEIEAVRSEAPPLVPGRRPGEFVNPIDGSLMVYVPAGTFVRGTSEAEGSYLAQRWGLEAAALKDEQPRQVVRLRAFYIDAYEVTNAQYAAFLEAVRKLRDPHTFAHPDEPKGKSYEPQFWSRSQWTVPDEPVIGVDWFDAYAYASWAGKRLPTEAEWERAARGTDGRRYPWGNDVGVARSNGAEAWAGHAFPSLTEWKAYVRKEPWGTKALTVAAGAFGLDRSPAGCYHMAGNVWEWCEDWYASDAYTKLGDTDPVQREPVGRSPMKVVRGGAWLDPVLYHRVSARRQQLPPTKRNFLMGFRCARDAR